MSFKTQLEDLVLWPSPWNQNCLDKSLSMMKWTLLKTNTRLFNGGGGGGGGSGGSYFIPWVFEPEMFNLDPLGVKELGKM